MCYNFTMSTDRLRRHVKIVSTLGPGSNNPEMIRKLVRAGADVTRLNLRYGDTEEHTRVIGAVRSAGVEEKLPTGILLDLPGFKLTGGNVQEAYGEHLEFAHSQNVDFIALSYITLPEQVENARKILQEMECDIPIIVKIEHAQALENSARLIEAGDGIMVARGDLANEISIEKVPLAQKRLISEANRRGKAVITATQMLESMVKSSTPTRAEATDVANAVLDGTDALMLSEETAIGDFPEQTVSMMVRIALEAEKAFPYEQLIREGRQEILPETDDATARAACQIADQVRARCIVAFTSGGTTALRLSKYRPKHPILAVTPSVTVLTRLSIAWGVYPVLKPEPADLEEIFELARKVSIEKGLASKGDLIVITAGLPMRVMGSTNLVKVHTV